MPRVDRHRFQPHPFDAETWRRMVELVRFLELDSMPREERDWIGATIVSLRLSQLDEPSHRARGFGVRRRWIVRPDQD